ncbi:AfsR/SARP family transcriptional regulator [Streptomyces rubradiris]|uniref:Actinorhodin operon activatory protein n=1 Tax=Streptomyces rubradiris TaxID=285531 RepID=A0ABQ3RHZ5_STRRR|nr:AfsR/SARP family transcriptional regulator [Streptomyces rubradiris]GHH20975.1 putative actinorhodin operon activatory protein [Streptomyces rubradiris]GHI55469.1 putative actinorhodin operon activatory protein [Streptomyces rubradiris]
MVLAPATDRLIETLELGVLGSLTVTVNGASIVPTARKPRQLLALLALRCGQVVPVATLVDEVWGNDIPRSSACVLQTYILQLRRLITRSLETDSGGCAKELIVTHFKGYQLLADPSSSDLRDFEQLSIEGDAALVKGNAADASLLLGRALSLWRGPALVDVPIGRVLHAEIIGLEERRMRVHERRIVADLLLGKHSTLIPELQMLVTQNPFHENFCAMLMFALHRSGATWRALTVFRDFRAGLVAELGVEPSPRLQRLHREVLENTTELSLRAFDLLPGAEDIYTGAVSYG